MSGVTGHRAGRVAILRLENEARANALTRNMLAELDARLHRLDADDSISCVLLTAAGSGAFSAGADVTEWADLSPAAFAREWIREGHRVFDRLARLPVPTIAVLHGHALGGGLELAAACDLRVMHPDATLGLPEAGIGVVPGWSGTQRLARLLPEPVLKELVLFGCRLSADRAHQLGLVAAVADDPLAAARELASGLDTLAPRAVEYAKTMIHAGRGEDRAAMVDALAGAAATATADRTAGVAAFRARRAPEFSGC